ncbi:MAG: peroxiredoxin [Verrucomicrobiales bacterium]
MSGSAAPDDRRASFLSVVKQGRSFSGRERHTAFLNQRDGTFADISAISGIDFPDDGRGLALTDWDGDGDLDLWFSNRNAPQLRYLENLHPAPGNFIAFRLTGTQCNRDAIGARVQVQIAEASKPLTKTLRAGDGFLSQSTKWLHFGIGPAQSIEKIEIRWPDGNFEIISGVSPNKRYTVVQGENKATVWAGKGALEPAFQPPLAENQGSRGFLSSRAPLPPIHYRDAQGASQTFAPTTPATLLVLWASWCPTCQAELRQLQSHHDQLNSAGVGILALSVDHLAHDAKGKEAEAQRFAFPNGVAHESVPAIFEALQRHLYDRHTPFQVPVSLLVTQDRQVAASYQGSVDVATVLQHVADLDLSEEARRSASVPFAGKWLAPVRRLHPIDIALHLIGQGHEEVSLAYYAQHSRLMANHWQSPHLFLHLGQLLERRSRDREALDFYYGVLTQAPRHVEALSRRAILLATSDRGQRNLDEASRLAEEAVTVSRREDALALHALGVVQAEQGFFRAALKSAGDAMSLARKDGVGALKETLEHAQALYLEKRPYRKR